MTDRRDFLKLLGAAGISVTVGQPELFLADQPAVPGVPKPWLQGECWTVEVLDTGGNVVHTYDVWGWPVKTWRDLLDGIRSGRIKPEDLPSLAHSWTVDWDSTLVATRIRDSGGDSCEVWEFDLSWAVPARPGQQIKVAFSGFSSVWWYGNV